MTIETENRVLTDRFSTEDRQTLIENNFSIVRFKGRSLFDFEKKGYRFVTFHQLSENIGNRFLKNKENIFSEKAKLTEIAYIPTGLYLPDSYRHSYYEEQKQMLLDIETRLIRIGIKNIKVIFPSVADCMELADIEAQRGINIFGFDFKYLLTRTSTENDSESTVIIGCDDSDSPEGSAIGEFRGIHLMDFPKVSNDHAGLYIIPLIIPVKN